MFLNKHVVKQRIKSNRKLYNKKGYESRVNIYGSMYSILCQVYLLVRNFYFANIETTKFPKEDVVVIETNLFIVGIKKLELKFST